MDLFRLAEGCFTEKPTIKDTAEESKTRLSFAFKYSHATASGLL